MGTLGTAGASLTVADFAIFDVGDAIGNGCNTRIMGDNQHRVAVLLCQLVENLDHLLTILGIEGGGGFIGKNNFWLTP